MERKNVSVEYEKPEIKDYGDLRELTETTSHGTQTDVPKGTRIFS